MTKKIILTIGILLVIGIAAFLIFSSRNGSSSASPENRFNIRNFFPFGNPEAIAPDSSSPDTNDYSANSEFIDQNETIPRLRKISEEPVAGAVLLDIGATTTVRFVLKDTGNVYEARSDSLLKTRLTNTTIPKINRAVWLPTGEGFLAQKADEAGIISTSYIRLKKSVATSSNELALPYEPVIASLPTGIVEVTPSPNGRKIFYYTRNAGMRGFISDPDGTNSTMVYTGNISEWIPTWFGENSILLTTKASFNFSSVGYVFNSGNRTLTKIFSDIIGGSATPHPLGKHVLASSWGESSSLLSVEIANESKTVLPVRTMAEKCAWMPGSGLTVVCGVPRSLSRSNYPDAWYQGIINTDDTILIIDVQKNLVLTIADPKGEVGDKVDVQTMAISSNGKYALFTNKIDQSLWLLELN